MATRDVTTQTNYNIQYIQELLMSPAFRLDKLRYDPNGMNMFMMMPDSPYAFQRASGMHIVANAVGSNSRFNIDFGCIPYPNVIADAEENGLQTLFTGTPIPEADILGVSIANPYLIMDYFKMMNLSRIPLRRDERDESSPLVVAGHMGVLNPAPFENYVDAFVIGDGDIAMPKIADAFAQWKDKGGIHKIELLERIADISGVYVPHFTERVYESGSLVNVLYHGNQKGFVEQEVISDLTRERRASLLLKNNEEAFVFIDYSCKYKCGFCQMANIRGKYRQNAKEQVKRYLKEFDDMGVQEVVLAGASSTNYDQEDLAEILSWAKANLKTARPVIRSVRIDDIDRVEEFLDQSYLHIAPETGSDFLRNKILLKTIRNAEMHANIERVIESKGFNQVRMYCIAGIPTETREDRMEYVDMILRTGELLKQHKGSGEIRIDMYPLMPQPGTPFEEHGMVGIETFRAIRSEFEEVVRSRLSENIEFRLNPFDPVSHAMEGILNTGDIWTGEFAFEVYKAGANLNAVKKIATKYGVDVDGYIAKGNWKVKPWDIIRLVNHKSLPKVKEHLARNIALRG